MIGVFSWVVINGIIANLITLRGSETLLYNVGSNKDIRNLSEGDGDTPN